MSAANQVRRGRVLGGMLVVFAVAMNAPFAWLAANFDYPDVLRRGAQQVLQMVREGGTSLIAAWYAYALVALAFAPLSLLVLRRLGATQDGLGSLAAWAGVGAALTQALGLLRWVFVVPVFARLEGDPASDVAQREAARIAFEALHQIFGVAIGEHLGQLLTAVWIALVSVELFRERARLQQSRGALIPAVGLGERGNRAATGAVAEASHIAQKVPFALTLAICGWAISAVLLVGLVEGFPTVIKLEIGPLGLLTPFGFMAFSAWVAGLGIWIAKGQRSSNSGGMEGAGGGSIREPS